MGVYQNYLESRWTGLDTGLAHFPLEEASGQSLVNITQYAGGGPMGNGAHTNVSHEQPTLIDSEAYCMDYGHVGKTEYAFAYSNTYAADWSGMWVEAEPGEIICRWTSSVRVNYHQLRLDDQGRYEYTFYTTVSGSGVYDLNTIVTDPVDTNVAHQVIIRRLRDSLPTDGTSILIDGTAIVASIPETGDAEFGDLQIGGFTLVDNVGDTLVDTDGFLLTE